MKIFSNQPIDYASIDFSKWESIQGRFISIHLARTEYIHNCLSLLDKYMQRYPNHPNSPIWEAYIQTFENELEQR